MKINKKKAIGNTKILLVYTLVYIIMFSLMFSFFIFNGHTLMRDDDILKGFENIPSIYRSLCKLFINGELQTVDYNLSSNIPTFHNFISGVFFYVLRNHLEIAQFLLQVFRLWGAGLTFFLYCYANKKCRPEWALFGSVIYISSGFSIIAELRQPGFVTMLIWYPVIVWGIDKRLAYNNTILIVLATAFVFLNSPFYGWYLLVATAIYIFSHIFFIHAGIRQTIKALITVGVDVIIGVGLTAFQFVPTLINTLSSNRINGDPIAIKKDVFSLLTYGWDGWINTLKYFFIWQPKYKYIASFGYFGISALLIIPVLFYCLRKEKVERGNKFFLLIVILLMHFPLFGKIAGISNETNRWSFCLAFVISYIAVMSVPELLICSIKEVRIAIMASCIIFLGYCIAAIITGDKYIFAECLMLLLGISVFAGIFIVGDLKSPNKKKDIIKNEFRSKYIAIFCVQAIIIVINAMMLETDSFISHYLKWGETNNVFQACPDYAYEMVENDTDFFRVEKESGSSDISCNLPRWYGYNGISSYSSLLYSDVLDYYYISGNPGVKGCNSIMDLDGRISDELLACVKYFLVLNKNTKIPYGFEEYKNSDNNSVYINCNSLPVAYSYEKSISMERFIDLNIAQQQETLLKRVVLQDDRINPSEDDSFTENLKSQEIEYRTITCENVIKDNAWRFGEGGIISMQAEVPKNCELYVVLDGIDKSIGENTEFHFTIDDYYQNFRSGKIESEYGNHQSFVCINLGEGHDGLKNINIESKRSIRVDSIKLFARNLNEVDKDVHSLKDNTLNNINFKINTITGSFNSQKEKWLCFSIPYSDGWSCKVDGVPTPLVKANIMYMAVNLPAGEHYIELNYYPVGRKLGWGISIISLSLIVGYEVFSRRKQKV